jgi:toxin FitB
MYLLDTNVISELRKGRGGDPGVHRLLQLKEDQLFIPVQVLGELQFGIESLRRKGDLTESEQLQHWMATVLESFDGRILAFDQSCALLWGRLRGGNDQSLVDKQIAAIAIVYGLTIVSRNVRRYESTGAHVLNPYVADIKHGTSSH